jgi:hypothetical protein
LGAGRHIILMRDVVDVGRALGVGCEGHGDADCAAPRVRQLHAPRNQISSISPNLPKMVSLGTLLLRRFPLSAGQTVREIAGVSTTIPQPRPLSAQNPPTAPR